MRRLLCDNKRERGMALVLVLLVLSVLTAMVVEFAYGIYVNTSLLTNWQRLQEISMAAESGVSMGAEFLKSVPDDYRKKNVLRQFPIPPMDPFGLGIRISAIVEDENSKLNLNYLEKLTGGGTEKYYDALIRLLRALELKESLAEAIRDHMYGIGTVKVEMSSVEELLSVAGIDREVYNTLLPYVTVYGDGSININTADVPVLMSLGEITRSEAEDIFNSNKKPFKDKSVLGFTPLISYGLEGSFFRVISRAMDEDGLTREIHCVIDRNANVLYWREL